MNDRYGKPTHVLTCKILLSGPGDLSLDLYPDASDPVISGSDDWKIGSRWKLIDSLRKVDLGYGYAISNDWWTSWRLSENGLPGFDILGPIDNSGLLDVHQKPKKELGPNSCVCVPFVAWYLLKTWWVPYFRNLRHPELTEFMHHRFGSSTLHDVIIPARR